MTCFETGRVWINPTPNKIESEVKMQNPVATSTVSMLEHPMAAPASASELTTYDLLLYDLILVHFNIPRNWNPPFGLKKMYISQTWTGNLVHCVIQKRIGCINDKDYDGIVNMNRLKIMMLKLRKWWVDGDPRRSADRMSATCQPPPSILLLHLHWNAQ